MISTNLKITIRNLLKNKIFSFTNIAGLSAGMTAAVFIFLWVNNEKSFNTYHKNADQIYRITTSMQSGKAEPMVLESSPFPLAGDAMAAIPEVESAIRIYKSVHVLNVNRRLFEEKQCAFVDKDYFTVFDFEFSEGNPEAFGNDPFGIILAEKKAKKYFGNTRASGQIISIDSINYTVRGVIKDNPVNSSLQFDILLRIEKFLADNANQKMKKSWKGFVAITFLQLREHADKSLVEKKLNDIVSKNVSPGDYSLSLQPLADIYFEKNITSSQLPHGNKTSVQIFSLLGILLLIIACINYVNLTTAKASLRAKEVSIKKIIGAERKHLFFQFLAESFLLCLLSLLVSFLHIQLFLPVFNAITEKEFHAGISSASLWKILAGTLLVTTILNGIYPSLILSSFRPLNVFRGISLLRIRDSVLRKGLVVFQLSVSLLLILGTLVMYLQIRYINTADPGYNLSQIFSINVPYKSYSKLGQDDRQTFLRSIKNELQSNSSISAVSSGGDEIVNVHFSTTGLVNWEGRDTAYNPRVSILSADAGFRDMFQLQLKEGRWFKPGKEDSHNFILNETAVSDFGLQRPIQGQRISFFGDTGTIVGIVKDFHYKSMHEKIGAMVITNSTGNDSYFFIKASPSNISKALEAAETVWTQFVLDQPFSYNFLDDRFDALYKSDKRSSSLILIFSVIAIIISVLGLSGLAAFATERRTKEISIRKILGASAIKIMTILSKEFILLVAVAILVAFPIALWAMNKWLENFAYRIDMGWWIFLVAGLAALLIVILAVGFQTIRVAITKPITNLRAE